ncbi:MAG TPA: CheR family methyltransferase [Roseiflexaceae bacterium]|nr:CheR family methyltransferase [Roseiflexaceae bacterium]
MAPHITRTGHVSLAPEQFSRLRDLLAAFGGVYLDAAQQRVLEAGLVQRLDATGTGLEAYEQHIRSGAGRDELRRLAELVLNHETFFFRNQPHLRALRDVLLPEIHRRKPAGAPIRIWSAGCATGEEPYSIAIAALEALGHTDRPIAIYGTDLSEIALEKARAGYYRGRALGNLTPDLLWRYFQPQGDGYLVGPRVRSVVRFAQLNLLDPFPDEVWGCDAIFCQNVTIYFQAETRRSLIARFFASLPPEGLLFLGFSETLWNVFDGFRSREVAGAYVYYKEPYNRGGTNDRRLTTNDQRPTTDGQRPTANGQRPTANGQRPTANGQGPKRMGKPRAQSPAGTQGGARRASCVVRRASDEQVSDDAATLQRSAALLDEGRVEEAIELLRHISPESPLAARALTLVARAHADRGDLELAVAEIRRGLEIDPLHDEAYLLLGVIYGRQSAWQAAAGELERARYLSPASPLISFHLADAYWHAGRRDLALREYQVTMRKLAAHPPDSLVGGVAVSWLRDTCARQIEQLARGAAAR